MVLVYSKHTITLENSHILRYPTLPSRKKIQWLQKFLSKTNNLPNTDHLAGKNKRYAKEAGLEHRRSVFF